VVIISLDINVNPPRQRPSRRQRLAHDKQQQKSFALWT